MNITSTYKLYYLGKDDHNAILVFLDSDDEFLYTIRPLGDTKKILDYGFEKDSVYGVTYNPDPVSNEIKPFHELIKVFDPITNKELSF